MIVTNKPVAATEVEGIFRLAGSERRIKDLQASFNTPERYGKGLNWEGYNVHDAANILRRYFNQLPEPIIPLDFYTRVREPLKNHQAQAVGEMDGQEPVSGDFDANGAIKAYQQLITELPPLNRQLLLYILDLLAVFASKSDTNRMTASNLAAIFQPGLLSHPTHNMAPHEYRLSQDVLIFLIENQDHFLVGMQGTAADEKTIQEVSSGGAAAAAAAAVQKQTAANRGGQIVGRSASNGSAGAESVRKSGGIRRNMSVGSRRSRQSGNTPSPVTPPPESPYSASAKAGGVHRSNTVPSKKSPSPALPSTRFQREKSNERPERSGSTPAAPAIPASAGQTTSTATSQGPSLSEAITGQRNPSAPASNSRSRSGRLSPHLRPISDRRAMSSDRQLKTTDLPPAALGRVSPSGTPSRERTFSSFFRQAPGTEADRKEGRKPHKLQKKRQPEVSTPGGESSSGVPFESSQPSSPKPTTAPFVSSDRSSQSNADTRRPDLSPEASNRMPGLNDEVIEELPPSLVAKDNQTNDRATTEEANAKMSTVPSDVPPSNEERAQEVSATLKANKSPASSTTSRSTGNGPIGQEFGESDAAGKKEKKHRRWLSQSVAKEDKEQDDSAANTVPLGFNPGGYTETKVTSWVGREPRPEKSFTEASVPSTHKSITASSSSDQQESGSHRTPLAWFKDKLHDKKEREKSPPPAFSGGSAASSRRSLSVAGGESVAHTGIGKSMEKLPEEPHTE